MQPTLQLPRTLPDATLPPIYHTSALQRSHSCLYYGIDPSPVENAAKRHHDTESPPNIQSSADFARFHRADAATRANTIESTLDPAKTLFQAILTRDCRPTPRIQRFRPAAAASCVNTIESTHRPAITPLHAALTRDHRPSPGIQKNRPADATSRLNTMESTLDPAKTLLQATLTRDCRLTPKVQKFLRLRSTDAITHTNTRNLTRHPLELQPHASMQ